MTGVTPFKGFTKEDFLNRVIGSEKVRPPLDFDEYRRKINVDDVLKDMISACWDSDISNRPASLEIKSILSEFLVSGKNKVGFLGFFERNY